MFSADGQPLENRCSYPARTSRYRWEAFRYRPEQCLRRHPLERPLDRAMDVVANGQNRRLDT